MKNCMVHWTKVRSGYATLHARQTSHGISSFLKGQQSVLIKEKNGSTLH